MNELFYHDEINQEGVDQKTLINFFYYFEHAKAILGRDKIRRRN